MSTEYSSQAKHYFGQMYKQFTYGMEAGLRSDGSKTGMYHLGRAIDFSLFLLEPPTYWLLKKSKNSIQNRYGYKWNGISLVHNKKYMIVSILFCIWNLLIISLTFKNYQELKFRLRNAKWYDYCAIPLQICISNDPIVISLCYILNKGINKNYAYIGWMSHWTEFLISKSWSFKKIEELKMVEHVKKLGAYISVSLPTYAV